jgi:predicted RNA binding protein YcfA (HicA-like mRNA interferase family)
LNPIRFRDVVFQLRHRISNVKGSGFDVVRRRGAHVRMSEDSLNHHIRHTETVQVASRPTPCRVPAVPLRDASVTFVRMVCFVA